MNEIRPTPEQIAAYQGLLTDEWTLATLAACIDLVEDLIPSIDVEALGEMPSWHQPVPPGASEAVRDFIEGRNAERAAEANRAASDSSHRVDPYASLSDQVRACLRIPGVSPEWRTVRDPSGFLRDVQSLLTQATLLELLPRVRRGGADQSDLLRAIYEHVVMAWNEDLAQRQFLLALIYESVGDHERALRARLEVFRLTPAAAHEYLTNAQAYWGALVERREFDRARRFVLDVYRTAEHEHLVELEEMLVDTFRAAADRKRGPRSQRAG